MAGRILTTHAGSLPRPPELDRLYVAKSRNEPVDDTELRAAAEAATEETLRRQAEVGIDVANNGEQARESFFTYVRYRMTGFGGASTRPIMADMLAFPTFLDLKAAHFTGERVSLVTAPAAEGDVTYIGAEERDREVEDLRRLADGKGFEGLFLTAASPGIVAAAMTNRHYPTDGEYLEALSAALAHEYRGILDAGLTLQIDAPDLALERHTLFADRPLADFLEFAAKVVAAINSALGDADPERVRLHVCWGNYDGPHHLDVPLEAIWPVLLEADVGTFVLSMANPRHAHEYRQLRELPPDRSVVAGVIDTTTNYVEHPEVVAERIERVAEVVGNPLRVLAGTDCGFATAAGYGLVAREVVWEKLRSLVAGAALASERLF